MKNLDFFEIKKALKKRGEEWPARGSGYHHFEELKKDLISEFINNSQKNKFNKKIFDFVLTMKPIVVCGSMKSGTTFFKSLFDGHKNIFVFPAEVKTFQNFINPQTKKRDIKELADLFLNIALNPNGRDPFLLLGDTKDVYLDFYKNFQSVFEITKKITLVEVLYCFIEFMDRRKLIDYRDLKFFLVKTPENEFYYEEIKNYFSLIFSSNEDANFFHVIRNPIQNIDSLKKLASVRNHQFNFIHNLRVVLASHFMSKNRENIEKYTILKYEDITSKTEEVMRDISKKLCVDFNDCMKIPTEFGKPLKNNSMKKNLRSNPAGSVYISKEIQNLTKQEVEIIKSSWVHNLKREIDENLY